MTREEKKLRKRQNRLMGLCFFIILIWVACLLCGTVNAASGETASANELPTISKMFITIGVCWTSAKLMDLIEWLDKPKSKRKEVF